MKILICELLNIFSLIFYRSKIVIILSGVKLGWENDLMGKLMFILENGEICIWLD